MAKTSKNEKQGATKKTSLVKISSNQKENRPKIVKINRDTNDSIGLSKQLMMKKSAQKSRCKRKPASAMRVMPSLSDLEKMFIDSDEDRGDITSAGPSHQKLSNRNQNNAPTLELPQQPSNTSEIHTNTQKPSNTSEVHTNTESIGLDLSPTTCISKVEINQLPNKPSPEDNVWLLSTSRKRKLNTEYIQFDDLPPKLYTIAAGGKENLEREKSVHGSGNTSEKSSESNRTLEHNLATSALQSKAIFQAFTPVPSTSKDIIRIRENDEKFSESLQINKNSNQTNETHKQTLTQTVDSPSIIIDDEVIKETPMDIVVKIDNDIEIIESHTIQINLTNTTETGDKKHNNDDDDDCVFVDTCPITTRAVSKEPEVIDLEYGFIKMDSELNGNDTEHIEDDIIDVDAIIALNESILNKYKTPSSQNLKYSNNLVIDVASTTIHDNTSNHNMQNQNASQPIIILPPDDSIISENMQSQAQRNNEVVIIHDGESGNNSNPRSQTGNECELVEADIEILPSTSFQRPPNMNYTREWGGRRLMAMRSVQLLEYDSSNTDDMLQRQISNSCLGYYSAKWPHRFILDYPLRSIHETQPYTPIDTLPNVTCIARPGCQTSTSCPSTQVTSPSQTTQHATLDSQENNTKTNTSMPKSNNELPALSPQSSEKGVLGDCPICMDKMSGKELASTICGHIYCLSCLKTAIKSQKRCPTCRKLLKNRGFHKIFL